MRQYAVKIKTSLSDKFDKLVQEANEELPISLNEGGELYMKNNNFLEEKNKILAKVSEKEDI